MKWFWYASPQTFFPLARTLALWAGAAQALGAQAPSSQPVAQAVYNLSGEPTTRPIGKVRRSCSRRR